MTIMIFMIVYYDDDLVIRLNAGLSVVNGLSVNTPIVYQSIHLVSRLIIHYQSIIPLYPLMLEVSL